MTSPARFLAALVFLCACGGADDDAEPPAPAPSETAGRTARIVATADRRASEAGMEMLRRGGSAADAAVAVEAVLGLVEPQSSGFGGGAFMMLHDARTGEVVSLDGREFAPAAAGPDLFLKEDGEPMGFYDAVVGGRSVGVPGAVAMLALAHERYGELPWAELFEPAIALAEEGFVVSPRLADTIKRFPRLGEQPAAAAYFFDETGAPRSEGAVLTNPAYAATLKAIAEDGPEAFYTGEIASAIVAAVQGADNPGAMTLEDLAAYEPVERKPVCGTYRAYRLCSMAPPSSGGATLLEILSILETFDMAAMGPDSPEAWHVFLEANRLAFADRNLYLADPDDETAGGSDAIVAGMASSAYGAARAEFISIESAMEIAEPGDPASYVGLGGENFGLAPDASPEFPSTSHFSIRDDRGNVVSMTATVEFAFGSHTMAAGMMLNNQLTDFSFRPTRDGKPVANAAGPRKRPRSSMSPVIVFGESGEPIAAIGSPGGPAIIAYVAKTLVAWIDWGMDLQDAIDLGHVVHVRGSAFAEEGRVSAEIISGLEAKGHAIRTRALTSGLNGFAIDPDGEIDTGADPRREGVAIVEDAG